MKYQLLVIVIFIFFVNGAHSQLIPEKAAVDTSYSISTEEFEEMKNNGIVLPPIKPADDRWANLHYKSSGELPLMYDMRQTPWLTSVKTQSAGGCWAYSVMGTVEARLLMLDKGYYDLSDNNLKICHKYLPERNTYGNHWMATSYFARHSGPFLESDDPYPGGTTAPENCPNDLTPLFYIGNSRYPPPLDKLFIKQTVLEYGPVWTLMYYHADFFKPTNATYYYGGNKQVNHAGVIVGWNDTLQTDGGSGAWIVKNTYGPNWGEGGYFYVSFFDSQFLKYNSYWPKITENEDSTYLYQYDEVGGYWGVGFGNEIGYGLVKFEAIEGISEIIKVGTFVQYAGSGIEIKIYGNFDGQISDLLLSKDEVICELPGYYTFDLDSTIYIPQGKSFYVQVKYNSMNPENKWPISVEDTIINYCNPQIESGKFWIAPNPDIWPTAWYQVGAGTEYHYDLCIKAYSRQIPMPPEPIAEAGEDITIIEGESAQPENAIAENYSSLLWSSDGDGVLINETTPNPTYIPGPQDIYKGTVNLIFQVISLPPLYTVKTDTLKVFILRYPTVELTFPQHGQKLCDPQIIITGNAYDPDGDLQSVDYSLNNNEWLTSGNSGTWSATITLSPGSNTLKVRATDAYGLSKETEEIKVICSIQKIFLPQGWSLISGFLLPDETEIAKMFDSVVSNLILLQNTNGIFAPPPININTLSNWDIHSGYKLKMAADDELIFCGNIPDNNQLELSSGYKLIPYLSNQPATIDQLFQNPATDILYVFDLTNSLIYWPVGEIYTLTTLFPGIGYQAFFINPLTINFPEYEGFLINQKNSFTNCKTNPPWNIHPTDHYHLLSIQSESLYKIPNGFLGIFDEKNNCVGFSEITDDKSDNLLLIAYGDDEWTLEKDGALEGEPMTFKLYRPSNQTEFMLNVTYSDNAPNHNGLFESFGMSIISDITMCGAEDVSHEINKIVIYPNPSQGIFTVSSEQLLGDVNWVVTDAKGQIITNGKLSDSQQINLCAQIKGIYFIRLTGEDIIHTEKLVIW
ncbi:MAG TPA: C1 family peptidase [Bacteroidales bacterium]|nr:C1 family peptidase [Bacteroidales bacterium]HQH14015.1 C1 family peptidase [Bacteroidales bacterium]